MAGAERILHLVGPPRVITIEFQKSDLKLREELADIGSLRGEFRGRRFVMLNLVILDQGLWLEGLPLTPIGRRLRREKAPPPELFAPSVQAVAAEIAAGRCA